MKRLLSLLVGLFVLLAPRAEAQAPNTWADTTWNNGSQQIYLTYLLSEDTVRMDNNQLAEPSVVIMCTPASPQLLTMVWTGQAATGSDSLTGVTVYFQFDNEEVRSGEWTVDRTLHTILPSKEHMVVFAQMLMTAKTFKFAYQSPDGRKGMFTFYVSGLRPEWEKMVKNCPLIKMDLPTDSTKKS